jgi:hypothetical protein
VVCGQPIGFVGLHLAVGAHDLESGAWGYHEPMRKRISGVLLAFLISISAAVTSATNIPVDSDRDGLSDALEDALLRQFAPHFLISAQDCSARPAEFVPLQSKPVIQSENGTIYGQAMPRDGHPDEVELHFYHLWRLDCGDLGHPFDAEHVSALLSRDGASNWKALYWYAAAHEDTLCDSSQITRASTVGAEIGGPQVWISRGKHGSFLSDVVCQHGCGGDECQNLQPLVIAAIINLGEPSAPAEGVKWIDAPQWTLASKMRRSDFPEGCLARVDQLSVTTILWAKPQKRHYQGAIHTGNATIGGVATGARATDAAMVATDTALDLANTKTSDALAKASSNTGNGLAESYGGVKKALSTTVKKVGKALGAQQGGVLEGKPK